MGCGRCGKPRTAHARGLRFSKDRWARPRVHGSGTVHSRANRHPSVFTPRPRLTPVNHDGRTPITTDAGQRLIVSVRPLNPSFRLLSVSPRLLNISARLLIPSSRLLNVSPRLLNPSSRLLNVRARLLIPSSRLLNVSPRLLNPSFRLLSVAPDHSTSAPDSSSRPLDYSAKRPTPHPVHSTTQRQCPTPQRQRPTPHPVHSTPSVPT